MLTIELIRILAVLVGLFCVSWVYDWKFVTPAETHIPARKSATSLEVVVGTLYTCVGWLVMVGANSVTGLEGFVLLLLAFGASGIPMIFGAQRRADTA